LALKLLVIDEIDYLPFDHHEANLFFNVVDKRYEVSSIIVPMIYRFQKGQARLQRIKP
jgi:DNA replication protein DnaC